MRSQYSHGVWMNVGPEKNTSQVTWPHPGVDGRGGATSRFDQRCGTGKFGSSATGKHHTPGVDCAAPKARGSGGY